MGMATDMDLIERAKAGSREALEELVGSVQDRVYGLALRMMHSPSQAEDATQEVLIKVITNLDRYRGEGKFINWVLRIASNHVISFKRSAAERKEITMEDVQQAMAANYAQPWDEKQAAGFQALAVEEARISCLHALLLTLDRGHRLAFILGVVFGVSSRAGAYILDISAEAYRKRLSRARQRIREFMSANCDLINPDNPCSCARSITWRQKERWMYRRGPVFATHPSHGLEGPDLAQCLAELDEMKRVGALFGATPRYASPVDCQAMIREMIDSGSYTVLN